MSAAIRIDDDLPTEDQLLILLRNRKHKVLLHYIDVHCRLKFRTEQSGASFESCIDWCAQNAGDVDDAKQLVLQLFAIFYRQLPSPVKANLAYLVEEIGYIATRPKLYRLKVRTMELAAATGAAIAVKVEQIQDYVAEIRSRRKPQSSVSFHAITLPASMMMKHDERFILDVPNDAEPSALGDNPCRAGGPPSEELRLSA
jgi:hypothetical protein